MFALNARRFRFSQTKNRVLGLVFGVAVVTLVLTTYFRVKSTGMTQLQDERMGVFFTKTLHAFVSDLRGLQVYNLKATAAGDRIELSWDFIPAKNIPAPRAFEIFRSTVPISSVVDLEKSTKVGEAPAGAKSFTDSRVPRSGSYYYAVVVRTPDNQYPLVAGKNVLGRPLTIKGMITDLEPVLKDSGVLLTWKTAPGVKGRYRILRDSVLLQTPARLQAAREIARIDVATGSFSDPVKADGHYFYALVPESGSAPLFVGETFTGKAVTIGQAPGQPETHSDGGAPFTLFLDRKKTTDQGTTDGDGGGVDDRADRESRAQVRRGIEPVVDALRRGYGSWLQELTIHYGYDYFFSTDQKKNPAAGDVQRPDGPSPVVFSDIANSFRRKTVEVLAETISNSRAESSVMLFLSGLSGDADKGYALKLYVNPREAKSSWGIFLLLSAIGILLVLLFYVYDRFVGKGSLAVSLVLLLGFSVIALRFVSGDVQTQLVRNNAELRNFCNTVISGVNAGGFYAGAPARFKASFADIGNNRFNEPDLALVPAFSDAGVAYDMPAPVLETERRAVFAFSLIVLLVTVLLVAGPLQFKIARGMGERFVNALANHKTAYLFTLPGIIILILLVFAPLLYTFILSSAHIPKDMHIIEMNLGRQFVGLSNFGTLLGVFDLSDTNNFYWTLKTTILFTVFTVIIQTVIGIGMSLILNRQELKFRTAFRTALILPWAIPTYVSALIFNYLFSSGTTGFMNQLLRLFGEQPVNWLYDVNLGIVVIILASVWYGFPFIMIVSLGALQSIPDDLYESATIEGASNWQKLTTITLPMIQPAVMPAVILSTVWTFNNFNFVYLMNKGWEGTDILITRVYDYIDPAKDTIDYGLGAAFSTVIFVILIVYIYSLRKLTDFTEKSF